MKKKKSRSQPKKKEEARRSAPPALSSAKGLTPAPSGTRQSSPELTRPSASESLPEASSSKMFPKSAASITTKSGEPHEDSGLHHAEFFAPPPPRMPHGMGIDDDLDEPNLRVFSPQAKERRKKNVLVVKWFVGGCLALVAIAGVRHLLRTGEPPPAPASVSAAQTTVATTEPTAMGTTAPSAGANTIAEVTDASASNAIVGDASATATAVSEEAGSADDASTTPTAASSPEEASKERNHAKNALESGRLKEAVTAGERSVSLDPTDADAWLYLGAAYQELGDQGNANRCYRACLAQGTHGNKGECSMMLK